MHSRVASVCRQTTPVGTLKAAMLITAQGASIQTGKLLAKGFLPGARVRPLQISVGILKVVIPIIARDLLVTAVLLPAKVHSLGVNVLLQPTHAALHSPVRPEDVMDPSPVE